MLQVTVGTSDRITKDVTVYVLMPEFGVENAIPGAGNCWYAGYGNDAVRLSVGVIPQITDLADVPGGLFTWTTIKVVALSGLSIDGAQPGRKPRPTPPTISICSAP